MLVALPAPSGSESSTSRKHCRSAVSQRTRPTRALDRQDRFRTAARLAHLHCLPVRRHVVELNLPRTRLRRAPRARSEVRGGGVGRAPTGQCGLGNRGELPRVPGSRLPARSATARASVAVGGARGGGKTSPVFGRQTFERRSLSAGRSSTARSSACRRAGPPWDISGPPRDRPGLDPQGRGPPRNAPRLAARRRRARGRRRPARAPRLSD